MENPYAAHAYFNRGNLYRSLGDYSSAELDYKKGIVYIILFHRYLDIVYGLKQVLLAWP